MNTKTAQEIIAEAAADMEMSEAEFVEAYRLGGSIVVGFTLEEIDILNRHIWGWDEAGDPDFTFLDCVGQYDEQAIGLDPADYPQYEDFAAALVECAVACGWADTVTARAAVEREEHILRMSHRQTEPQPYYVGCAGVPARSGEHNDRAVFVGRDEAAVRAEMEQVWQHDAWVAEWESYGVWEFDTLEDATKFATLRAGGEYWEEID